MIYEEFIDNFIPYHPSKHFYDFNKYFTFTSYLKFYKKTLL